MEGGHFSNSGSLEGGGVIPPSLEKKHPGFFHRVLRGGKDVAKDVYARLIGPDIEWDRGTVIPVHAAKSIPDHFEGKGLTGFSFGKDGGVSPVFKTPAVDIVIEPVPSRNEGGIFFPKEINGKGIHEPVTQDDKVNGVASYEYDGSLGLVARKNGFNVSNSVRGELEKVVDSPKVTNNGNIRNLPEMLDSLLGVDVGNVVHLSEKNGTDTLDINLDSLRREGPQNANTEILLHSGTLESDKSTFADADGGERGRGNVATPLVEGLTALDIDISEPRDGIIKRNEAFLANLQKDQGYLGIQRTNRIELNALSEEISKRNVLKPKRFFAGRLLDGVLEKGAKVIGNIKERFSGKSRQGDDGHDEFEDSYYEGINKGEKVIQVPSHIHGEGMKNFIGRERSFIRREIIALREYAVHDGQGDESSLLEDQGHDENEDTLLDIDLVSIEYNAATDIALDEMEKRNGSIFSEDDDADIKKSPAQKARENLAYHSAKMYEKYKTLHPATRLAISGGLILAAGITGPVSGALTGGSMATAGVILAGKAVLRGFGSYGLGELTESTLRNRIIKKLDKGEVLSAKNERKIKRAKWGVILSSFALGSYSDMKDLYEVAHGAYQWAAEVVTGHSSSAVVSVIPSVEPVTSHVPPVTPSIIPIPEGAVGSVADSYGDTAVEAAQSGTERLGALGTTLAYETLVHKGDSLTSIALRELLPEVFTPETVVTLTTGAKETFVANIISHLSPEQLQAIGVPGGSEHALQVGQKINILKLAEMAKHMTLMIDGKEISLIDHAYQMSK